MKLEFTKEGRVIYQGHDITDKAKPNRGGYLELRLNWHEITFNGLVHREVFKAHSDEYKANKPVRHRDKNKLNNRLENLYQI